MLKILNYSKCFFIDLRHFMLLTCFLYSDSIATGLVNALLNSGDNFQMEKGRGFLKRLNKQLKKRKRAEDQQDEN